MSMRIRQSALFSASLFGLIVSAVTQPGHAQEYFCLKEAALLTFARDGQVFWQFGPPPYGLGTPRKWLSDMDHGGTDCSNQIMFCLQEYVPDEFIDAPNRIPYYVYAIPRVAKPGMTYTAHGFAFRIEESRVRYLPPDGVMVRAKGKIGRRSVSYMFVVRENVGITDIYFDEVPGYDAGAKRPQYDYLGVGCRLFSEKGLFPEVSVKNMVQPLID